VGWGETCYASVPLHHKGLCDTQEPEKIGAVSATTWCFGPEDLVKTTFIIIYCKKSMDRAFEKFKIASLEAELRLSKLQLISQNHTSINWS
jgi:hypothetical protein